ncbi:hypothetical protein [Radiobacillus sp. PE A8.2]|uniref:hypothetical protein n=1 Tax=Radiobacillus sp. PE A8.2 TaxID=3380349 RepID=UPI0038901D98
MTKKRLSIISISIIILLALFLIYWFYFAKPTLLPSDEQMVEKMNQVFPIANVETIQDTIKLDAEHVFVPFISTDNHYGVSYWEWKMHSWKPVNIDTVGEPMVWKIDRNDPTSNHILWNIHPEDKVSYANFYLIRDRNYHISYGEHTYVPKIQMEETVNFEEKSYGVLQMPDNWRAFMNTANKLALAQNSQRYSSSLLQDVSVYIGWTPFEENNEVAFPENSVNGSGYSNGNVDMNFVMFVGESDLEK